ncbi:hypothetical protein Terro_1150 [Terriglobus roseus DSM 18391]|uniref:Uncharacterized protein n=1 Tax=Terriglobus roseus (strain DSM 18391 / NRRL B-41598 / KBS 63) TaxID=926566 RepID=I3ZDZ8_TERRK|nr:hypothetical protein [Terriglobus roseus]AFL87466.1 hypothetical protein Terro_1150 [Terriglobus roseus DSM 18391]
MRLRLAIFSCFFLSLSHGAVAQRLVLVAQPRTPVQMRYFDFLLKQLADRGQQVSMSGRDKAGSTDRLIVGTEQQMPSLLSPAELGMWQQKRESRPIGQEGYSVTSLGRGTHKTLILSAASERGELFAVGWFLRSATYDHRTLHLPFTNSYTTKPDRNVRGYQIGYRMKNNTYDAWTLDQFRQQMLDMAVFGLNTMQVVAPISDDDPTSPLFPAPAETTVLGLSQMSQDYDLRFDLFYPEMAKNYADPDQSAKELRQFEDLIRKLPRVDSIHVPGGDPGHTAPEVLLPLIEQEAEILHRYHPKAEVWVSAQGFTAERYKRFYELLEQHPAYLSGIFFGPQSRESMEQQRAKIPAAYPIEFYPDTAHAMHSQFPVPKWDPIFALTEGREPIDPRPAGFEHIYKHFYPYNNGFIVYSEGVNDDINKVLWGGWGWSLERPTHNTLLDYARYFFQAAPADDERIASAVEGLERNWDGPLLQNTGIAPVLAKLEKLHPANSVKNWRWDSLLYRGSYDRYLQIKRLRELRSEQTALKVVADDTSPPSTRIEGAMRALRNSAPDAEERKLHTSLTSLASALFQECGLQLSVKLYGASNWERGANFDRIDTPLNDRTWLETELNKAGTLRNSEQREKLSRIANWSHPVPGALYDDLGDPASEAQLVKGSGWQSDPELYHSSIDGIADETLEKGWRLSWLDYAETLYEQPLQLHYTGLKGATAYTLRITYAGEEYKLPMQLKANGVTLLAARVRASNPEQMELPVNAELIHKGELTLEWSRPYGAGGGGRGGQIAEVWLLPVEQKQ